MPELAEKCIASWKRYCPDYEIICWNEENFDVHMNAYTEKCFLEKKWAYLSDYARLWIVSECGGIYFDTDVELLRSPDFLLENEAFFGFENDSYVATGLGFGSEAAGKAVTAMLAEYDSLMSDSSEMIGCPILNTRALEQYGLKKNGQLQKAANALIFPKEYFNPYDDPTGRLFKTNNTVSVHWYMKSALGKGTILRSNIMRPIHRMFGTEIFARFRR